MWQSGVRPSGLEVFGHDGVINYAHNATASDDAKYFESEVMIEIIGVRIDSGGWRSFRSEEGGARVQARN